MASSSSEHAAKPEEIGGGESSGPPPPIDNLLIYRGLKKAKKERGCTAKERISKMPPCTAGKRSSIYRGVTRHRWTGRYEAHLWDKSTWNQNQNKKGKQVYLGAYDDEEAAARAYDLAALKYWGPGTLINFPVTDYSRDLDEMQSVSREDYLASLRRKSSGFARGISKYQPLSSRWDSQLGRTSGADYTNSVLYGTGDVNAGSEYAHGYGTERKIDLSNYIKWWGPNKLCQTDLRSKALDETGIGCSDEVVGEIKELERSMQPTEPYQMPRLGVPPERMKQKSVSAMNILLKSTAYKSLQDKVSKNKEKNENDEKENKSNVDKIELGKAPETSCRDSGNEECSILYEMSEGLPIHRNAYPLSPLLSAPLLTSYSSINPLPDPILWSSLIPVLPSGSSSTNEVAKNESGSGYPFFQHGQ